MFQALSTRVGLAGSIDERRWRRCCLAIVLIGTTIRLAGWLALAPGQGSGEAFSIASAIEMGYGFARPIVDAKGKTIDYLTTATTAPGYVGVSLASIELSGGLERQYPDCKYAILLNQAVNIAIQALTIYLLLLMGRQLAEARVGIVAGIAFAIHPAMILYSWINYDTSWTILLLVLLLYSIVSARKHGTRTVHLVWCGILCGLVSLFRPEAALVYPLLLLWGLRSGTGWTAWGVALKRSFLVFLVHCAVISPWIIRNHVVFGKVWYVRSSFWMQLWACNGPASLGGMSQGHAQYCYTYSTGEMPLWHQMGEAPYADYCRQRVVSEIVANPGRFAVRCAYRLVACLVGDVYLIPTEPFSKKTLGWVAMSLGYTASTLFAAWGFLRAQEARVRQRWLLLGVVCLLLAPSVFITVSYRYLAPAIPFMVLLGANCALADQRNDSSGEAAGPRVRGASI